MSNPFFSIVIPSYNRSGLIGKTIESVLQQSCQDFEIVIVDNKSTDNTVEVLQPYLKDPRIRLHVQEQNYERSRSRNKGMELAKGNYLTFLDSDDLLYNNSLGLAKNFAAANPGTGFFHHHYENRDMDGKHVYSYSFPAGERHLFEKLLLGNFLSCIGVFISRDIYQHYRFDEKKEALGSEDWDFWIRICADHELKVIPEIAAAIIQHDARTVQQNKIASIVARKKYYLDKYRSDPGLPDRLRQKLPIFEAGWDLYTATVAYQSSHYREGYKYVMRAFSCYPASASKKTFWKVALSPVKKIFSRK